MVALHGSSCDPVNPSVISRDGKMPRGGVDHHAIYLKDGRPLAWRLGMTGKWLIDASGTLHVWRTIDKWGLLLGWG